MNTPSSVVPLATSLEKVTAASIAHHIKGLRPSLNVMQGLGFSAEDCLTGTGITQAQLEQMDQGISLQQEYAFYRQLVHLSQEPLLGLHLGKAYRLENYGMLGYAILSASTLGDALSIARDFGPLSFSHFHLDFELDEREARIIMHCSSPLDETLLQLYEDRDCSAIIHGTRNALGTDFPVQRIELMHVSEDRQGYEDFFGCPVSFGHPQMTIAVSSAALNQPMPLRDPETSEYCRQQCQQLLEKITSGQNLKSRVKQYLERHVSGIPCIQELCTELGISERSLRRKLANEGDSFQALINQVRFEKARHLLEQGLKLEDIASQLGYSEAGNFSHAFKRWSGMSPKTFRSAIKPKP